jgi:voltage-gated potassium channel
VQVLFRPRRVHQRCPSCGLSEHESDAVYCKRCGTLLTSQRRAGTW